LGEGGMGAGFLAEKIAVGNRPVALKVLSRKLLDDPDFLRRFQAGNISVSASNPGAAHTCLLCMRPRNTGNVSFTASNPWPVLAS